MLRSVTGKTLFDQRRALLAWSMSLALLVAMYVAIWPSIRGQPSMSDLLDRMPEAMRSLFAMSGADMSTPTGYVKIELLSFMGPMLLLIYTIAAGAAAVAGEEDRHTLDLLLANPISRTRLVLHKLAAMALGTALLAAVMGVAMIAEGSLADMGLPVGAVLAAMLHMALLALVFGAFALAIGATSGRPGLSRAVPAVVAVLAYIVNGLGPVVSWLEPLQKLSPFYQYAGHDPLVTGVSLTGVAVAVGTVTVLVLLAVLGFRRRDVAA
ncbi:MAG: ABC transporter permease subunit [Actinobacteria bacterium]|nr:ABC transporter permease subunit [Actinomycetota bacterium]